MTWATLCNYDRAIDKASRAVKNLNRLSKRNKKADRRFYKWLHEVKRCTERAKKIRNGGLL